MAAGYNIYRGSGTSAANARKNIDYTSTVATCGDVAEYQFAQSDLAADTWYAYAIRAQNSNDTEDLNTDVFVISKTDSSGDYIARPNSPASLRAEAVAGGKVKLTWSYNPNDETVDKFVIYYDNGTGVIDYVYANRLSQVEETVFTFTTNALSNGVTYSFAVRARTTGGVEDSNGDIISMVARTSAPVAVTSPTASVGF